MTIRPPPLTLMLLAAFVVAIFLMWDARHEAWLASAQADRAIAMSKNWQGVAERALGAAGDWEKAHGKCREMLKDRTL